MGVDDSVDAENFFPDEDQDDRDVDTVLQK